MGVSYLLIRQESPPSPVSQISIFYCYDRILGTGINNKSYNGLLNEQQAASLPA